MIDPRFPKPLRLALAFGLGALLAACAGSGDTTAPPPAAAAPAAAGGQAAAGAQGLAIQFATIPDPPTAGGNTLEVTVVQPDGTPVTDASVAAVLSMPAMPSMNMPAMRTEVALAHVGEGKYRGAGELSMGGTWNVAVTVAREGKQLGSKKLSVVAR